MKFTIFIQIDISSLNVVFIQRYFNFFEDNLKTTTDYHHTVLSIVTFKNLLSHYKIQLKEPRFLQNFDYTHENNRLVQKNLSVI